MKRFPVQLGPAAVENLWTRTAAAGAAALDMATGGGGGGRAAAGAAGVGATRTAFATPLKGSSVALSGAASLRRGHRQQRQEQFYRFGMAIGCGVLGLAAASSTQDPQCYYTEDEHGNVDRMARWESRWKDDKIMWHRQEPFPALVEHYDRFLGGGAHRVLVPLCGKTVDMPYLSKKGHEVVGVEGVEVAVLQLAAESWLNLTAVPIPVPTNKDLPSFIPAPTFQGAKRGYVFGTNKQGTGYYQQQGTVKCYTENKKNALSVIVSDFFEVGPETLGNYDRIWDRAALVALPPNVREEYVKACDELLRPGGVVMLTVQEYDQSKLGGPPFSLDAQEVKRLYGTLLGYRVELLSRHNRAEEYSGGKWKVLDGEIYEATYLLTKRGGGQEGGGGGWGWLRWVTFGLFPRR